MFFSKQSCELVPVCVLDKNRAWSNDKNYSIRYESSSQNKAGQNLFLLQGYKNESFRLNLIFMKKIMYKKISAD